MQFITLSKLSKMLLLGSNRIIENRKIIDNINVFPVADSDTGSNLTNTFLEITQILKTKSFTISNKLVDDILESAFANSRGNSGIMIASYLKGFLTPLKVKNKVSLSELASSAMNGFNFARNSIERPLRGTMLDVMEAFSLSLNRGLENDDILLIDIFHKATQKVKTALIGTEKKLKILRTNRVVDAGALGFTHFVYGLYEGLSGKLLELSLLSTNPIPDVKAFNIGEFPHEVIFTVKNSLFKQRELRKMFNPLGDSIDIIEIEEKLKIHIHTDKPEVVKETAQLTGEVISMQVVDMRT